MRRRDTFARTRRLARALLTVSATVAAGGTTLPACSGSRYIHLVVHRACAAEAIDELDVDVVIAGARGKAAPIHVASGGDIEVALVLPSDRSGTATLAITAKSMGAVTGSADATAPVGGSVDATLSWSGCSGPGADLGPSSGDMTEAPSDLSSAADLTQPGSSSDASTSPDLAAPTDMAADGHICIFNQDNFNNGSVFR